MNISRRSFIVGGSAAVAAASITPVLSSCTAKTKSGLDFAKFETNGVGTLGTGLEKSTGSDIKTKLYTITNEQGSELCVTNFGARIVSLMVPNKDGDFINVVLGFDDIRKYANYNEKPMNVFGAVCGRYANRIKKGQWTYNGKNFQVDQNENGNMLHGGKFGTHNSTFDVIDYEPSSYIKLECVSEMGDMGFPGRCTTTVTYTLNEKNTVGISYAVICTQPCPINVSSHTYWCPSGDPTNSPITEQNLTIYSNATTPVDDELIPTGEIRQTPQGDVFDFFGKAGEGKFVGKDNEANNEQIKYGKGYDHNFILMTLDEAAAKGVDFDGKFEITSDGSDSLHDKAHLAAKVKSEKSGITMTITTTEPAIQFFDCHDQDGSLVGIGNKPFEKHAAFVLEPQHYPDSPNHANFPDTMLTQGQVYRSKSEYKFEV